MVKTHFDELEVGETFTAAPFSFSEADIIRFCKEYDPQFFHTDPVAAKGSIFGGLIASGWQTAAMTIQALADTAFHFPDGIIGLGTDKLRWKGPVRPDEPLTATATIIEARRSSSRPNQGITIAAISVGNDKGEEVLSMETSILVPIR